MGLQNEGPFSPTISSRLSIYSENFGCFCIPLMCNLTNGKPKPDGLLSDQLGNKIFSVGSYVGEVLKKKYGGKWIGNDKDPDSEINLELRLKGDIGLYPIQKTIKRLQNGSEDSLYFYGKVAGEIQKN